MTMATTADRFAGAWTWARTNAPKAALEIAVNFALPFLVYSAAKDRLGDVGAMIAASAPPLVWGIAEFIRRRRIDALSLLALAGIVLSVIGFVGGGGVRFLQLRERLVTAVIGLVFLGSAAIGKPLIFQLAQARMRREGDDVGWFAALRDDPRFRRAMTVMTLAWGIVLVGEAAVCGALVFTLSIKQYLIVNPIIGYPTLAATTAWTYWYARRRIGPLRREAANLSQP
jgi:hypothetical protein